MEVNRLIEKCDELYDKNSFCEVIKTADEILDISKDNQIALGYKSRSLYDLGRSEEALPVLEHALDLYPDNYRLLYIKAMALQDIGDFTSALECFEKLFRNEKYDNDFCRLDYESCYSGKINQLIEEEKYSQAFECYLKKNSLIKTKKAVKEFMRLVRRRANKNKRPKYCVKSSKNLLDFLNDNEFKQVGDIGEILLIDVIHRTFTDSPSCETISESKFLDKVNFYPRNKIVRKKLYDDNCNMIYEGNTLDNCPYGFGTLYFADGSKYREGIFDVKGIVQGKEYYTSGQLRFEGEWSITYGYGPNAPREGKVYDENGNLTFSGKFKIKRGGVGYPMIQSPKGYTIQQKHSPKISYYSGFY